MKKKRNSKVFLKERALNGDKKYLNPVKGLGEFSGLYCPDCCDETCESACLLADCTKYCIDGMNYYEGKRIMYFDIPNDELFYTTG